MMTPNQCIRLSKTRCDSLVASYQKIQQGHLTLLAGSKSEQLITNSGVIAAYDLALCSLTRLRDIHMECFYERLSEEQTLRMLLDGLTREVLFLGSAKGQTPGQGPVVGEIGSDMQRYHQSQAEVLEAILWKIEAMLGPVLTCYITSFLDEKQIQSVDAEPRWSETTRRTVVAEVCQTLYREGQLDETYFLIARELLKIEYPRDIHSEEDRYRRCALPTLVHRLLVRDLIAFIAGIKVECAGKDAWYIAFGGCLGVAQALLERRATTIPVPERGMRLKIFQDTLPLLDRIGIAAVHPEPCLLCQTHDGRCDVFQVAFPEGTEFGEASQTEYDHIQHSYTFTPTLPGSLPRGWYVYLCYSGIWEANLPWTLMVLDMSESMER